VAEVLQRFLGLNGAARRRALLTVVDDRRADDATLISCLPAATRTDVMRWLGEAAGSAGEMVLGCVEAGRTIDALPLGLVCGVVFAPEGEGQAALGQAAIRLERFVNDKHIGVPEGRAWARAAEQVVRTAGPETARATLDRADACCGTCASPSSRTSAICCPLRWISGCRTSPLALSAHVAEPTEANLPRWSCRPTACSGTR
jgi:hypothetical protein